MTSFTSSFKRTVFGKETRRKYAIVLGSQMVVLLATAWCCQLWINDSTAASRQASQALGPSTRIIVVGSSHLLGQNSATLVEGTVNLSHAANSMRMMDLTLRRAIPRASKARQVVMELGHVVLTSEPVRLRGHTFVELGIPLWDIPGTTNEKMRRLVERFPPLRIPRLTPQNLVTAMRPELNADAQGFKTEKVGHYTENGDFRAAGIHYAMANSALAIADNFSALDDLLTWLSQQKLDVIIVLTPYTTLYRQSMTDQEDALLLRAKNICDRYKDIAMLDLYEAESNGFANHDFVDSDHLNSYGNKRLGKLLRTATGFEKTITGDESR